MRRSIPFITAVVAILLPLLAGLARADQPADDLKTKMLDAYKNAKTYQATVHFEVRQTQGRWKMTQAGDFKIAVDRAAGKVMIDKPDFTIATDGAKLRAKTDQFTDHFVEMAAPSPLDYDAMNKAVTFNSQSPLARPPLPDVMMLLAADPIAALNGGKATAVKTEAPAADDPQHRPRLRLATPEGRIELRLDPATNLISAAVIEMSAPAGPPDDPDAHSQSASLNYEFAVEKYNQPLDPAAFAFNTTGSTPVGSMKDLIASANGVPPSSGVSVSSGGGGDEDSLEGKAPPPVKLKTLDGKDFDLASEKADVVVFDFWATWCGPCRQGLPKLQKVADWARDEKKPVAFYPINVQETPDVVKSFWTQNKYTMPVLMDTDNKIAEAYHVQGIPQTVVISKGKVVHVIVGFDPNEEESLKAEIEGLLKK